MSRGKGADGPEDVDATFAEIVADLRAEGVGLFPDEVGDEPTARAPEKVSRPEPAEQESGWRGGGGAWEKTLFEDDPAADEEHYVPPEPPPLPRPRKGAFVVLLFLLVGLLLLIAPAVVGLSNALGTPLGILALATGIALLLLRVRQGPPPGADPNNGAQV
ncbi:hypothetical protein [Amycolatopsis sp. H20-H5]|uniref:hypothetical protein n=1 Tax=Amycolatopsis sp. H20-H5 TaxID=3046309 RepID=UPI002DC05661|nr:hypothetical protein [Amycolatopsis sp. H20-H5]MEC3973928.1 hypothetical protein [Amycolatopsis sp. H20-H5]